MKKGLIVFLAVVFVLLLAGTSYASYYYWNGFEDYKKENLDLKNKVVKLEKDLTVYTAKSQEAEEDGDETKDEDADSESAIDTSSWLTYTNSKYNYTFKHPASYGTNGCSTKPCGEFIGEESGGDRTMMQGDISQNGWPNIDISHLSSNYYNPPANTDFRQWILDNNPHFAGLVSAVPSYMIHKASGGGYAAYDITVPGSQQAYSQRYIIFLDDDSRLFTISMTDHQDYSEDFYSSWLNTVLFP
ncbi:MAG: hypothetical protein BWY19_00144 [bacterium ADurb.Bin212]|nr:MAG: hypothetical protein BWY19_00144 [bacterium ADurb.Bin212]